MVGAGKHIELVSTERYAMNQRRNSSPCASLFAALDDVRDPEIPALSIWQLGILQDVIRRQDKVVVVITPTYSGCPAITLIKEQIVERLAAEGVDKVVIEVQLSPAWSTDWLDAEARTALYQHGIAPPQSTACPNCGGRDTQVISQFGSTACKALYRCRSCGEPFDHFRPF